MVLAKQNINIQVNRKIAKALKITITTILLLVLVGWLYIFKIPAYKAETIANNFENAVRNNDKDSVKSLVSSNLFWSDIVLPRFQLFQNEFAKFHEGVEVYKAYYHSGAFLSDDQGRIIAYGKMRAKIDNKYRDWFEISLLKEGGEWKLHYFYFPDFVDY